MARVNPVHPLFTDLYQLTMLAGYFEHGFLAKSATFDLYFRKAPFGGSYAVWAGLEPALQYLQNLRFSPPELDYLRSLSLFSEPFLDYLAQWKFTGRVTAIAEGAVVFPHEPLISITAPLGEAQLVETALLNIVNFQTLVATKAARTVMAAGGLSNGEPVAKPGTVIEFGARRAQGPDGARSAARAAFIGGAVGTSNVEAGQRFGLPVTGTHAHAWVQAFADELTAFRAYASAFPGACTLLIDTYDTLASGLPNAITVARELAASGQRLRGVRLDSGDLAYLSRRVRAALDEAGFGDVRIVASNDLDEHVIESVIREGGRIDVYGVGTQLVTAGGEGGGALGGVYKLVELEGVPKIKLTADREKSSIPGAKRLWRVTEASGRAMLDLICLEHEQPKPGDLATDPTNPLRRMRIPENAILTELRQVVMDKGQVLLPQPTLVELQNQAQRQLRQLPEGSLRLLNPHIYRVSLSQGLLKLRADLIEALEASLEPENHTTTSI
jgi:nicotinate phosphoribosyltransferase